MLDVQFSTNLSIFIQIVTGLVSMLGIFTPFEEKHLVIRDILIIETFVQIIELFFYFYFLRSMATTALSQMASIRYFDWIITTPTMLLTTIIYFKYLEHLEKNKLAATSRSQDRLTATTRSQDKLTATTRSQDKLTATTRSQDRLTARSQDRLTARSQDRLATTSRSQDRLATTSRSQDRLATTSRSQDRLATTSRSQDRLTLWNFIKENKKNIILIFLFNFLMLLFGYLGEIKIINMGISLFFGFIFFGYTFYLIYIHYAINSKQSQKLFYFILFIWGLYGIAAIQNVQNKNNMFNILDIFAKNFFGIYLYIKILSINKSTINN
jgi:hypothetical protein